MGKIIISIIMLAMIIGTMAGCKKKIGIPDGEPIIREEYSTETPTEITIEREN